MDEQGFITNIRTIRRGKSKVWVDDGESEKAQGWVYRYKYTYEVAVNGEIVGTRKTRKAAKALLDRKFKEHEQAAAAGKEVG